MPTVQEGIREARERDRDIMSWFKLASEKKQEEYLNSIRERQMALEERKGEVEIRLKNIESANKLRDIATTEDKAIRAAKFREWARANGADPKSQATKEREQAIVNASPEARMRIANGAASVATHGEPAQTQQLLKGFATGEVGFQAAEAAVKSAGASRSMSRMAQGQPSVSSSPAMPTQTSRLGAPPAMPPTSIEPGAAMRSPAETKLAQNAAAGIKGGTAPARKALGLDNMSSMMFDAEPVQNMGELFAPPKPAAQPQGASLIPGQSNQAQMQQITGSIGQFESGGRNNARNPGSTATGKFQYLDGTWADRRKLYKPEWAEGMDDEAYMAARTNPEFAQDIMERDVARYAAIIEGQGYPATGGRIYAFHQLGPTGARALFRADPDTPTSEIFPPSFLQKNKNLRDMTAGELIRSYEIRHGSEPLFSSAPEQPGVVDTGQPVKQPDPGVRTLNQPPVSKSASFAQQADESMDKARTAVSEFGDQPGAKEVSELYSKEADRLRKEQKGAEGKERALTGLTGVLEKARDLPTEFGKEATERAMGPAQATTDDQRNVSLGVPGAGASFSPDAIGQDIARGWAEAKAWFSGGAKPSEVRDRIEAQGSRISALMKPLIREPGEGTWTDKDQAFLERLTNGLSRSRDLGEYGRRLDDITNFIQDTTGEKLQLNPPTGKPSANAPISAEDERTTLERIWESTSDESILNALSSLFGGK